MKNCLKKIGFSVLFFSLAFGRASFTYAQERVVKLKDGTTLQGTVLSKENDVYKIMTSTLGVISVKDADIVSIETGGVPPWLSNDHPQAGQTGTGKEVSLTPKADIEAYKQKIMTDPNTMKSIQSLTENKEFIAILNDPQLRSAIMRQDIEYLKNNEKFQKLSNDPEVRKIAEEVQASTQKKSQ